MADAEGDLLGDLTLNYRGFLGSCLIHLFLIDIELEECSRAIGVAAPLLARTAHIIPPSNGAGSQIGERTTNFLYES